MFTMMNNARLAVGLQGVAIAERAYQQALQYAQRAPAGPRSRDLREGMSPIVEHPDVQRNLLTMKSLTAAARAICYMTAESLDRAHRDGDENARRKAHERASLLTPVAKAFSTDIGVEVASLGECRFTAAWDISRRQVRRSTCAMRASHPIYEGTNGIQAIDLVMRKLPLSGGAAVRAQIAAMRAIVTRVSKDTHPASATPRRDCARRSRASTAQRAIA